jgi:membrane-associated phospholipid phosphatase
MSTDEQCACDTIFLFCCRTELALPSSVAKSKDMSIAARVTIWIVTLLGVVTAVVFSIFWVDRPLALFAHDHFRFVVRGTVAELSYFPNPLVVVALVLSGILTLRMIFGRPLSWHQANIFVCSLGVIFTEMIKNILKFIFGRTWPETWVDNNPSFIRDGIYGFHFMHGGSAYQSFPSGHMAAACTVLSIVWIRYPDFRPFSVIAGLLVGTVLVGANYHFLSDVIAGAFVGISVGWIATVIWDVCVAKRIVRNIDMTKIRSTTPEVKRRRAR